ncbi:acid protease [Annulohypoxylon maeteangense]|uniref:acid protease n=1 Tax=Annulohypoxylon maeteangense TaxID=1927788 RepID=UPI002007C014|nr:acid protease [Annulohypoxylon maeteangense]KAI0885106.1 acid protease [Annulohypoxylon maeteangense]
MALFRLLLLGLLPFLCLSASLKDFPQLYGPRSWSRLAGGNNTADSGRHIRAKLQSQKINNVTGGAVSTYGTSKISDRSPREPLARYGAGIVYMLELDIGTPGQKVSAILDTGSYTLLLDPDCKQAADPEACQTYGFYDTAQSSTAKSLNGWFSGQFGTGFMQGVWYSDTAYVGLDYLPLPNLRIGVSKWSQYIWAGVLGVSYGKAWNTAYQTLLDLIVFQNYIEVPIFSVGVGYQGGGSPSDIIFGGVDRKKYRGYLEPLEIYPYPEQQLKLFDQVGYRVNLTSLAVTPPGENETMLTGSNFERNVLIDSGSTYTYLDANLVAIIAKTLNANTDEHGVYRVPCENRDLDGSVNFGFNFFNMVIRVNYADFIVDFDSYCALGVQPIDHSDSTWVLGTSFIRAAYLVFDQLNNAVWIAQYLPCGDDGVEDLTKDAGRQLWLEVTGLC